MNRSSKNSPKKRAKAGPTDRAKPRDAAPSKDEPRDPLEARTEAFRVSAARETIEAFVVAFILALLFRAFLAEAFVIPTGSMAPTLMGAHKDVTCDRCQTSYRTGASLERREPVTRNVVVATVCPNCRHTNPLDLAGDANDSTFNGDRILVSKFAYTLADPQRWDVIVFKYPGNPKQNYIKRLVGLPGETLTIRHGDVYTRPAGTDVQQNTILRKPPYKLLAMRQLVYDTDHQSPELITSGYPSRWQPWTENAESPPEDSWQIVRDQDGLTASVKTADQDDFHWLRYYHRWPDQQQWQQADQGGSLASVDPYSSRLITDFYAYNAYVNVYADDVYQYKNEPAAFRGSWMQRMLNSGYSKGILRNDYQSGENIAQFKNSPMYGSQDQSQDGMHWVGDLMLETEIETSADAQELLLELVEAGVKYRCRIDLANGNASLQMVDEREPKFDDGAAQRSATTAVRAGQRNTFRLSNFDDQLLLWINDSLVEFDGPTTFDVRKFRSDDEDIPVWFPSHPLDGAPAAIAVRGGSATAHRMRIDRDKYYIATKYSGRTGLVDYDDDRMRELAGGRISNQQIQQIFSQPELWVPFVGWQTRRQVEFTLDADQFFPMGDNSPESLDARCWAGTKLRRLLPGKVNEDAYDWSDASYVPRDLLVGKALVVFWPHSWSAPVPFTPNFKRMKLIR